VVKKQLRENTEWAIVHGVFGVSTFLIEEELFWGDDALDMVLDYLHDPEQFQDPQMQAIERLPVGITRLRKT
jgi:hypothetical protein